MQVLDGVLCVAVIWFVLFLPLVLNHTNYLDSSACFLKDSGNISAGSAAFHLLLHLDEGVRSGGLKEKFCQSGVRRAAKKI